MTEMNCDGQRKRDAAFTLVELLVLILVVAMFTGLMLPALAGTRSNTKAAQCSNNSRRLTAAWLMYASDNADRMIANPTWVGGAMDWGASLDNTNSTKLIDPAQSLVARYVRAVDLFKCPADNYVSLVQQSSQFPQRVRSVSLNAALGGSPTIYQQTFGRTYFLARKITELNKPGPANTLVIFDEHPDSIDDGAFFFDIALPIQGAVWRNVPGSHHNGAGTVSFADGGAMVKRWQDARTIQPVLYFGPGTLTVPNSVDYVWVNDRMPYR